MSRKTKNPPAQRPAQQLMPCMMMMAIEEPQVTFVCGRPTTKTISFHSKDKPDLVFVVPACDDHIKFVQDREHVARIIAPSAPQVERRAVFDAMGLPLPREVTH